MPKHFLTVDQQIELMLDLEERATRSPVEQLALDQLRALSRLRERQEHWSKNNRERKNRQSNESQKRKRQERGGVARKPGLNEEGQRILRFLREHGPSNVPSTFSQKKRRELARHGYLVVTTDHGKPALHEYNLTEKGFAYVERLNSIVQQEPSV